MDYDAQNQRSGGSFFSHKSGQGGCDMDTDRENANENAGSSGIAVESKELTTIQSDAEESKENSISPLTMKTGDEDTKMEPLIDGNGNSGSVDKEPATNFPHDDTGENILGKALGAVTVELREESLLTSMDPSTVDSMRIVRVGDGTSRSKNRFNKVSHLTIDAAHLSS